MSKPRIRRSQVVTDDTDPARVWEVEWHSCLSSTMDRAQDLAEAGAAERSVVVADFQEQGRGTRGRSWLAPPGTCLTFSLIYRPQCGPEQLANLPMQIAERVAKTLRDRFRLDACVKAPNDVMIGDRKICGILCTSRVLANRVEWVTCGVGLNTTLAVDELPVPHATSLAIEGVDAPDHGIVLEWLLDALGDLCDGSARLPG